MSTLAQKSLLVAYIREAVKEAHLARVPDQLVSTDSEEGRSDIGDSEDVNEFSGVGGIMGYTGPLGIDPDELGRKKNKPKRK